MKHNCFFAHKSFEHSENSASFPSSAHTGFAGFVGKTSFRCWLALLCTAQALALLLYSCDPPESGGGSPKCTLPTRETKIPAPSGASPQAQKALDDIQTKYAGNMGALYQAEAGGICASDNVLLVAHGGPEFTLLPISRFSHYDDASYKLVVVKQGQMLRPGINRISPAEAQEINLTSIAILYALAKSFQDNGHKVSLYANSWGSFLAAEMLRQYGDAPFEKLLISSGRLDMQSQVVDGRRNNIQRQFKRDGTTIFDKTDVPDTELKAVFALQADLLQNRYTTLLQGKTRKVIYYFGGQDQAVGRLSEQEVRFLTNQNSFSFSAIAAYKTGTKTHTFLSECVVQVTGNDKCTLVSTARPDPRYPLIRNIYTVPGSSGFATVKFAMEDAHSTPTLTDVKKADMIASFP